MRHLPNVNTAETPARDNEVELAEDVVREAQKNHKLLRGLSVMAAGFSRGWSCSVPGKPRGPQIGDPATFVHCLKGGGWWEGSDHLRRWVRRGDLLVLLPGTAQDCGPRISDPWTVQWVRVGGDNLVEYLREFDLNRKTPVLRIGEDPQLVRLFGEVLRVLQRDSSFPSLLQASQGMGYLLSCLIHFRHAAVPETTDTVQKAAQAIIYMSEHLTEPLRISTLARLAGVSSAHFSEFFKKHMGCSPREYLHLLRMHQASRFLQDSRLSIKEVAGQVGYQDPLHFSRQFKDFQGVSPRSYRDSRSG